MNRIRHISTLKAILGSIVLATVIILAFVVIRSGYVFEFDIDELYHANTTYLIAHGYVPFKDFFLPYSPIFHIFMLPLYAISGFTLTTIQWTRLIMIGLFIIRIVGAAMIVRILFGSLAAFLFLPLFLLDPLTGYTSMQIRPDNLMMTVYVFGFLFLSKGLTQNKRQLTLLSGILFGLSLLISIKIFPSIGVLFLILFALWLKLKFHGIKDTAIGFAIPIALFCVYYLTKGLFFSMITNLLIDARAINETLKYPVPMGNFYWPSGATYYGLSFKPVLFQYLWSLPLLAFAGAYATFLEGNYSLSKFIPKNTLRVMLAASLVLQWLSLFFIRSVFIQYYLPITWLFGIFAAVALAKIIHAVEMDKFLYGITLLFLGIVYTYYFIPSLHANIERAKVTGTEQKATITAIWNHVPEVSAVYPGVLFRPLAYPIPYGFTFYDLPQSLFNRYEPIQNYLEKNKVSYLNIDGKPWAQPDESVKQYISSHYIQDKEFPGFWKRK